MKRFIAILLFIIFAASNSGMAITIHYCKGRFAKVEVGASNTCCCKKKVPAKCCTSKTTVIKLKTSFVKDASVINHSAASAIAAFSFPSFMINSNSEGSHSNLAIYPSPPDLKDHTVLNRVFRI
jgi:hypothetical protein